MFAEISTHSVRSRSASTTIRNRSHSYQPPSDDDDGGGNDHDDSKRPVTNHKHFNTMAANAPITYGENSVLNNIERNEDDDELNGRKRRGTIAKEFNEVRTTPPRSRRSTVDSMERAYLAIGGGRSQVMTICTHIYEVIAPVLWHRLNIYFALFFFLVLMVMGRYYTTPRAWFNIFLVATGTDLVTCVADQLIFAYVIDVIFAKYFETAFLLHAFNGPAGLLATVFIIGEIGHNFKAPSAVPNWDRLISASTVIILCVMVKNWMWRRYYTKLLEKRFSDRLFKLQSWTMLLSELATYQPHRIKKPTEDDVAHSQQSHLSGIWAASSSMHHRPSQLDYIVNAFSDLVEATSKYNDDDLEEDVHYLKPPTVLQTSNEPVVAPHSPAPMTSNNSRRREDRGAVSFVQTFAPFSSMRKEDASAIHAASNEDSNPEEQRPADYDLEGQNENNFSTSSSFQQQEMRKKRNLLSPAVSSSTSPPHHHNTDVVMQSDTTQESKSTHVDQQINAFRKKRTFWELASRMSRNLGALTLYTYNGRVTIRRKVQAKAFAKSLYSHLSRGGRDVITHEKLEHIFQTQGKREENALIDDMEYQQIGNREGVRHRSSTMAQDYGKLNTISSSTDKDNATFLYEAAIDLFDPFRLGHISEEQLLAALCLVYKEQRFAGTSLNDYGELHQSLRSVIGVLFWIGMVLFLQFFLGFDLLNYLLPFYTLMLTLSFALGSLAGNMFLAITFVFFMQPYEVGNKVYIGSNPTGRVEGFVLSVSLLYTTITTYYNEVLKIPNHQLFNQTIYNAADATGGAVFPVDVSFNLGDAPHAAQVKVEEFLERVRKYLLVDHKLEWSGCLIFGTGLNTPGNAINYSIWATHRDSWQDVLPALASKTEFVGYLKKLQVEMGLHFVNVTQPVQLIQEAEVIAASGLAPPSPRHPFSHTPTVALGK